MEKLDIKSYTLPALTALLRELGQPAYRARQLYGWLHQKQVLSFDEMTDLPRSLRETLAARCYITELRVVRRLTSRLDGTVKFLFSLPDGQCIETVVMEYHHGTAVCISTQVGCRMGCSFCASTLRGLVRSLTPSEMLDELYAARRETGREIGSVVLMGIGEPLDNFENVLAFLEILSSPEGMNLSLRHLSLSTCGLCEQIDRLAERRLGLTLSVSLHAPTDELRTKTMPVNRAYPIDRLMRSCRNYFEKTGRRISFEYALIDSVNDSEQHARQLADLLSGMACHVNLIPVNQVKETGYRRSRQVERFRAALMRRGINATVRRELGSDIAAACGQLRSEELDAAARRQERATYETSTGSAGQHRAGRRQ